MMENEPLDWTVRIHADYTEHMTSDEYAIKADRMLCEARVMYPFTGDSDTYYVIRDAAELVADIPGLFCEIGFRCGAGIRFMIEGVHKTKANRTFIAIDPYGDIPYRSRDKDGKEVVEQHKGEYSNLRMKQTLELMNRYVACYPYLHFLFFPLEDTEFFERFSDGVPVYTDGDKKIMNEYALVHFDGPHTLDVVMNETKFFLPRTPVGAMFVYDDIKYFYDHDKVEEFLFENGWLLVDKTAGKASYVKTS